MMFALFSVEGLSKKSFGVSFTEHQHQSFPLLEELADVIENVLLEGRRRARNDYCEPSNLVVHVVRNLLKVIGFKLLVILAFPDNLCRFILLPHDSPEANRCTIEGHHVSAAGPTDIPASRLHIGQGSKKTEPDYFSYKVFKFSRRCYAHWQRREFLGKLRDLRSVGGG